MPCCSRAIRINLYSLVHVFVTWDGEMISRQRAFPVTLTTILTKHDICPRGSCIQVLNVHCASLAWQSFNAWSDHCCFSVINDNWRKNLSRSQWQCGLRYEMSSLAQTLGSFVRIPLKVWMFVCVYSVFVLTCVDSGLATGWTPVQGVLPTKNKKLKWKAFHGYPILQVRATGTYIELDFNDK
jgi:hypothetical protein